MKPLKASTSKQAKSVGHLCLQTREARNSSGVSVMTGFRSLRSLE